MIRALAPRLVLGALLLVGLELLPWALPRSRSPLEWPLLLAGATALAALLLDVASRLRLRDGFGVLALAGLAGVTAALLLNPGYALASPPATWFTRALGSLALGSLAALLLFLRLGRPLDRRARLLALAAAAPLGALWGYWARWSPQEAGAAAAPTPPEIILLAGALALAGLLLVLALARRGHSANAPDFRLPRPALALLLLGLLALLAWRITGETVDPFSALVLGIAGLMCAAILYYQKRDKGLTLLGRMSPVPASGWLRWMPPLAILTLLGAGIGASLARGAPDGDALVFMAAAVTVFGFLWLPGVALVIGARAFSRRARMDRL
jgi:hypothetical protein